jgi:hypothetical protein
VAYTPCILDEVLHLLCARVSEQLKHLIGFVVLTTGEAKVGDTGTVS